MIRRESRMVRYIRLSEQYTQQPTWQGKHMVNRKWKFHCETMGQVRYLSVSGGISAQTWEIRSKKKAKIPVRQWADWVFLNDDSRFT